MELRVKFFYKNHRGEVSEREIDIDSLEWISNPNYGYQPGWFLSGFDLVKNARRSFALCNMVLKPDAKGFFKLFKM